MKIGPLIESCVPLKMFSMQDYEGFLLGNIKTSGSIKYEYIFGLFQEKNPVVYVTAEKINNSGSLVLGLFDEKGHANLGPREECADQISFLMLAMEIAQERFGIDPEQISEIKKK